MAFRKNHRNTKKRGGMMLMKRSQGKKLMEATINFTRFLPIKNTFFREKKTLLKITEQRIYEHSPIPEPYTEKAYTNEVYLLCFKNLFPKRFKTESPSIVTPEIINDVHDRLLFHLATYFYQVCSGNFTENSNADKYINIIYNFMKDKNNVEVKNNINITITEFANILLKSRDITITGRKERTKLKEDARRYKNILMDLYETTDFETKNNNQRSKEKEASSSAMDEVAPLKEPSQPSQPSTVVPSSVLGDDTAAKDQDKDTVAATAAAEGATAEEGGGKRRNTRRHKKKANQTHRKKHRRNSRKKHNTRRKR